MPSLGWRLCCISLGFTALAAAVHASAHGPALPRGWRLPNATELSDSWRSNHPAKYSVAVGDFDGDGRPDQAMLLISDDRHSLALFVHSGGGRRTPAWRKLDETPDGDRIHAMGIETIAAGSYVTACGKVDGSCRRGEPKKITSSNPLINYFKSESANRFLYYDKRSKMFKQVWMSD